MNIFEEASRRKLRFKTSAGLLTVEQLWTLPLVSSSGVSLDSIAVELSESVSKKTTKSYVNRHKNSLSDVEEELAFKIAKHIIDTRLAENEKQEELQTLSQQKKLLEEAILAKRNENLLAGSLDDLQKRLEEINKQGV